MMIRPVLAFLALVPLTVAADQANVEIRANILGTCKIESVQPIDFGDLEPSTSPADKTAPGTVRYWCTKGAPYTVTLGNGSNYLGSTRRMKGQASTNSTEFLAYEITADSALTGTGVGPNTPVDFAMTGKVKGPDYNAVSVGGFLDTVIVTILP